MIGGFTAVCGRYYMDDGTIQAIQKLVGEIDASFKNGVRTRDIHPSETAPMLVSGQSRAELKAVSGAWGFPGFDKRGLIYNARSETALEKKMFSSSVMQRRCVIPAAKFYEWDKSKNKVAFLRKDAPVMYLAGFYDFRDGGNRFVILTTAANASMAPIHDRMPLILEAGQLEEWVEDLPSAKAILRSVPVELEKEFDFYQEQMLLGNDFSNTHNS